MGKRKYTDEQLIEAVKNSMSIRQVLSKIGLVEAGGNYAIVKKRIKSMGIDNSHFTGKGHLKGKTHTWSVKTPIDQVLMKDTKSGVSSHSLKRRLIKEGYFEHKCYCCGLAEWRGQPIPIELEHIDGERTNQEIGNLTLLCPNCHAQTPTYRGKNIGGGKDAKNLKKDVALDESG